jgi:hypothetical protein
MLFFSSHFFDKTSAVSLTQAANSFLNGSSILKKAMTLISMLYKFFKLNPQRFSFINGYTEGLLKMSWIQISFMISNTSKGFFQAD